MICLTKLGRKIINTHGDLCNLVIFYYVSLNHVLEYPARYLFLLCCTKMKVRGLQSHVSNRLFCASRTTNLMSAFQEVRYVHIHLTATTA